MTVLLSALPYRDLKLYSHLVGSTRLEASMSLLALRDGHRACCHNNSIAVLSGLTTFVPRVPLLRVQVGSMDGRCATNSVLFFKNMPYFRVLTFKHANVKPLLVSDPNADQPPPHDRNPSLKRTRVCVMTSDQNTLREG